MRPGDKVYVSYTNIDDEPEPGEDSYYGDGVLLGFSNGEWTVEVPGYFCPGLRRFYEHDMTVQE